MRAWGRRRGAHRLGEVAEAHAGCTPKGTLSLRLKLSKRGSGCLRGAKPNGGDELSLSLSLPSP
eukprot:3606037-Pleurochrysis_carterae.AAC.1